MTLLTIESIIIGLLGIVCALLSYWAIRLENRIATLESALIELREGIPKEYLTKNDCRERTRDIFDALRAMNTKTDNIVLPQNNTKE